MVYQRVMPYLWHLIHIERYKKLVCYGSKSEFSLLGFGSLQPDRPKQKRYKQLQKAFQDVFGRLNEYLQY